MSELHDDIRRLNKEVEYLETRIEELEQQNKQMIELLIEYLKSDFTNGTDDITVKNQELIESVTGKPIEEIIT